jgi:hypothetical protein
MSLLDFPRGRSHLMLCFGTAVNTPLSGRASKQAPGYDLFTIVRRRVPIEAGPDELRERGIEVVIPLPETLPWQQHALPPTGVRS